MQVCSIPLAELVNQNRSSMEEVHVGEGRYSSLVRGSHQGPVIAISCAQSKPLLISAGEDLTIRVMEARSLGVCHLSQLIRLPRGRFGTIARGRATLSSCCRIVLLICRFTRMACSC